MAYVNRTIIVAVAMQPLALALVVGVAGESQSGMFKVPLAAAVNPSGPVGAYLASGPIEEQFAQLLEDSDALYAACQAVGASVTKEQCQALIDSSTVVDLAEEGVFVTLARLELVIKEAT